MIHIPVVFNLVSNCVSMEGIVVFEDLVDKK